MTTNVFRNAGGNLPNGVFSPAVYSKNVLMEFRRSTVASDITNTDYFGEIANFGDTVHIIKEPTMSIQEYSRGQQLHTQAVFDDEDTLTIDTAMVFQFAVDDIETKQAHVNWQSLATSAAMYRLKDDFDKKILAHIASTTTAAMTYGDDHATNSIDLGFDTGEITPLAVLGRLARLLDEQNVPTDNRWVVASPRFWEVMMLEDSKVMGVDFTGDGTSILRNGKITEGVLRGFRLYTSNNMPAAATASVYQLLAGHNSAVATANAINKTEVMRSEDFFGDKVRGMHMYGKKTLRDEALVKSFYRID